MPGSTRIIPLGGLGEVGKNMTVYEADGEAVVVDAGLAFPRDEHLGVDLILPDFSYLTEMERPVRAILLTHGHEDHVGALPYVLRQARVQEVWATRLTLGLIKSKLDEHGLLRSVELREADPEGGPVELGPFRVEFIRVAHSIPDAVAIVLDTPGGRILHTGDYKMDHTPVDGLRTDVGRLAELGDARRRPLAGRLDERRAPRSDGLGAARRRGVPPDHPGAHGSCPGRLVRIERPPDAAGSGRGSRRGPEGLPRGALDAQEREHRAQPRLHGGARGVADPPGRARRVRAARGPHPLHGQPGRAALGARRIAYGDHPAVKVEAGDTVIISAKPVPGNELRVHDAINQLARSGAEVLHQEIAPVHVSGHGNSEELRTMLGLVRPKAVMPVHGEFRMLAAHARLAREGGVPEEGIVLAENGSVVELTDGVPRIVDRIEAGVTFVDGLGVGDVQDVALRDRRHLSEDGVLIVVATLAGTNGGVAGQPELIARGFGEPGEELIEEMREEARRVLADLLADNVNEIKLLQEHLHDGLGQLVYDRTGRRPMILPVVVEV